MELKKIGKNIWDRFSFFLLFTKPEQLCVCILTSKSYWFFKALVNLLSFKKNHLAVITVHICLLKCNWICSDSLRKWLLLVVLMRALPAHMLRNIAKKNSSWQAVLRWPWFLCFCSGGGGYFSFFLSTQTEVCCTEISVLQQHASNTKHFFFFPLFLFFFVFRKPASWENSGLLFCSAVRGKSYTLWVFLPLIENLIQLI